MDQEQVPAGGLEDIPEVTQRERIVKTGAATSTAMAVGNFFVSRNILSIVSNSGAVAIAPVAVKNEAEIIDIQAMIETNQKLSIENDRLKMEVDRLNIMLSNLEENTSKFEDSLDTLLFITKQQEFNVDKFEQQVKEQKAILEREKENKVTKLLQMFLSIIIKADTDGNFIIDDSELDKLLDNFDVLPEIIVNKPLFREKVKAMNGSLPAVLDICRNIINQDEHTLDEEKVLYFRSDVQYF